MIEVHCDCGRSYRVPDGKVGKKLQCRRCGAVQRIGRSSGREELVVDFKVAGGGGGDPLDAPLDLADDGPGGGPLDLAPLGLADDTPEVTATPVTASAAGRRRSKPKAKRRARKARSEPLELRDPLRRCPSCGHQDEASVVICVSCGYDFKAKKRLRDVHENMEISDEHRSLTDARIELERLGQLAWFALSPLGVVVGPYLILRSQTVERRLRAAREPARGVSQIRLTAAAGALLWIVVAALLSSLYLNKGGQAHMQIAREARVRMERVGRVVRTQVNEDRRFPKDDKTFRAALDELTREGGPLAVTDLRCPLFDNLYPFKIRKDALLTPDTDAAFLLVWDPEPYQNEVGRRVLRALRFDGTVEEFALQEELDKALERVAFPGLASADPDDPPGTPGGNRPPPDNRPTREGFRPGGPLGDKLEAKLDRFLAFAAEFEDGDPDLTRGLQVDPGLFVERMGVPPRESLPVLIRRDEERVRDLAARMLVRLQLDPEHKREILDPLLGEDLAPGVRFGIALTLKELGAERWLEDMALVAENGDVELREHALAHLGRYAIRGPEQTRRILDLGRQIRLRTRSQGAHAMIPLPPGALEHVIALLEEPGLEREARAVLFTADADGRDVLMRALEREPPFGLRVAIYEVVDLLRREGSFQLDDLLLMLRSEIDPAVPAAVLDELAEESETIPGPVIAYLLEVLRGGDRSSELAQTATKILGEVGRPYDQIGTTPALQQLVDDLLLPGDHTAVLTELAQPYRGRDSRIEDLLLPRWDRIDDPTLALELVRFLARRLHPKSLELLLKATEHREPNVREAAVESLLRNESFPDAHLRGRLARELSNRITREDDERIQTQLIRAAADPRFSVEDLTDDEYDLSRAIFRALSQLARRGNGEAIRALAQHPSERVASFLVDALDGTRDDTVKQDLISALQATSGLGLGTSDARAWQDALSPTPDGVKSFHRRAWSQVQDNMQRLQQVHTRRLETLPQ